MIQALISLTHSVRFVHVKGLMCVCVCKGCVCVKGVCVNGVCVCVNGVCVKGVCVV